MKQKYCEVGGQALIEGIMMRNKDKVCVSVLRKDNSITNNIINIKPINKTIAKIPILRGLVALYKSLSIGMKALEISADYMAEDDENSDVKSDVAKKNGFIDTMEKLFYPIIVVISFAISIGLFVCLPAGLALVLKTITTNELIISISEGLLRIIIFIGYIKCISTMPDIKRTFRFHGAEHKCLNCIEHGLTLNVENVMKSSKEHKRCGTSFIVYIMIISIIIFTLIPSQNLFQRMGLRLLIVPLIAGLSYEILLVLGKTDNKLANALIKPGLWMQKLTTYEPDGRICEVAIEAINQIFDWKKWQEDNFNK